MLGERIDIPHDIRRSAAKTDEWLECLGEGDYCETTPSPGILPDEPSGSADLSPIAMLWGRGTVHSREKLFSQSRNIFLDRLGV